MLRKRSGPLGSRRNGMTLVELLVVIAIIGILAALLLPAIGAALRAAWRTRVTTELANIHKGMENFREEYGKYPPDFSDVYSDGTPGPGNNSPQELLSWQQSVAYRFIRSTWTDIDPAELEIIRQLALDGHLNHANVVMLWLNGISKDTKFPFTGKGGPFNADKLNNTKHTFREKFVMRPAPVMVQTPTMVSNNQPPVPLVLPIYFPEDIEAPFIYFDSRTYVYKDVVNGVWAYAGFAYPDATNFARPYKKAEPNLGANVPPDAPGSTQYFMNRNTFQIISAGRDHLFGWDYVDGNGIPAWPIMPNGAPYHPVDYPQFNNINLVPPALADYFGPHKDNFMNFTEGKEAEDAK